MAGGVGGTAPKTRGEKIVWWVAFTAFSGLVSYVLVKNFLLKCSWLATSAMVRFRRRHPKRT